MRGDIHGKDLQCDLLPAQLRIVGLVSVDRFYGIGLGVQEEIWMRSISVYRQELVDELRGRGIYGV